MVSPKNFQSDLSTTFLFCEIAVDKKDSCSMIKLQRILCLFHLNSNQVYILTVLAFMTPLLSHAKLFLFEQE